MAATSPQLATGRQVTSATLVDVLNDIEARFQVAQWSLDDIRIWPIVRVRWFFAIWSAAYGQKAVARSRFMRIAEHFVGLAAGRMRFALSRLRDRAGEDHAADQRQVVFLSDGISFVDADGLKYERFCDPLIELLRRRGISSLMLTPSHQYAQPRATPSMFVQPFIDAANMRGMKQVRYAPRAVHLPDLQQVRQALARVGFDHPSLAQDKLAGVAETVAAVADAYGALLDRIRPQLAFIVSYYNLDGCAFALACRRRDIPLVDVQHGVQGPLHPAYGRLPAPPPEGFNLVPDRFWVWSAEEARAIAAWAGMNGRHRAIVGGNLWLDRWLRGDSASMRAVDLRVRELRLRSRACKVVLVTLQWGLSEDEQLAPLAQFIERGGDDWAWWVRLHPVMLQQRNSVHALLRRSATGRVVIDEVSDLPLYGILRHVDVHLTHSSSTVLEAIDFGVSSVLTSRYGAEVYPQQLQRGDVVLADRGIADVLQALARQAARRTPARSAAENAANALDQLLEESGIARQRQT